MDHVPWFCRIHTAVFFVAAYTLADPLYPEWTGLLAMLTGLAQWACAWLVPAHPARAESARISLGIDGAVFLALAVPIQFDGYSVVVAWTIQALFCLIVARRINHAWLRIAPPALFILAFAHLQMYEIADAALREPLVSGELWHVNRVIVLFVAVGLAAYLGGAILGVRRERSEGDQLLISLLGVIGTAAMLFIFAHQFERYAATWAWLMLAALWIVAGVRVQAVRAGAVAITLFVALKFIGWDLLGAAADEHWRRLDGFLRNRAMFTAGLVALTLAACIYILSRQPLWIRLRDVRRASHVAAMLALAIVFIAVGTFEIARGFRFEPLRHRFENPHRAMHLFLSVFWSAAALTMLIIGFAGRASALRYLAIGMFTAVVIKVSVVDISHLGMVYRIVSFLVVGALLIVASLLYQKLSVRISSTGEAGYTRP